MIFVVMALGDIAWWIYMDRRLRKLPRARLWRALVGAWNGWMIGYLLIMLTMPYLTRRSQSPIPTPFHAGVYLWHLLVLPLLVLGMPIYEAAKAVTRGIRKLSSGSTSAAPLSVRDDALPETPRAAAAPSGWTRRDFLGIAAAAAAPPIATAGLVAYASHQLAEPPRVRSIALAIPTLPTDLDGMTIAHVTDMHVGKFTRAWTLPRLADQVNALRADFVAVTGDLIDMSLSDLPAALDFLNRLDARHGSVVCEGNHDVIDNAEVFERALQRSGHPFLFDSDHVVSFRGHPLQFLGIRWGKGAKTAGPALKGVLVNRRPDAFPILLAHHPHAFDPAARHQIPLTLSGHTHGGQLMLTPNIGAGPLLYKYWSGVYRQNNCALVVSNGVGAWFPLRINAPAEIIHLTLRRAPIA